MQLPPKLVASSIVEPRHVYYDKKSKERRTGIVKPKYKVAMQYLSVSEFFPFYLFNTDPCAKTYRFTVKQSELENRNPSLLSNDESHIDVRELETHTAEEIIRKRNDRENGFPLVAKLKTTRFAVLRDFCAVCALRSDLSKTSQSNILNATGYGEIAAERLNGIDALTLLGKLKIASY